MTEKMGDQAIFTVLYLITGLNIGGAEMQLYRIVTRLNKDLYRPMVVSLLEPGPVADMLDAAGISVYSLGILKGGIRSYSHLRGAWRLYRVLRREQPCILVSFMFHANILGRIVGRLARASAIISSIRNTNIGGRARDLLMRYTSWFDDAVIINSQLAGEQIVRRGVVAKNRLRVIPNGLDVEAFHRLPEVRGEVRSRLKLSDSTFVWLAVGRLELQKDYPNLLQAFAKVIKYKAQTHLLIAGDGLLKEELQKLTRSLGIENSVQFLGLRQDIPDLLIAADAFVLASAWEGLPNVVMEAMAAGRAVVATKVGGTPELVVDEKTSFTVPARDSRILAEAMLRLMNVPEEERRRMGLAGRKLMEERYSLDKIVQQWEALYTKLLQRKGLL